MALEDALQYLVEEGIGAGWRPDKVIERSKLYAWPAGGRSTNGQVDANLLLMNILAKQKPR
ncbi:MULTISPECIES: hypothetical protein [unclassified Mesorhizobium]|uniref:hypothetical protein n=1 Tax=unclassified Mesorhizobium TaxID=325217 RepID=UPI0030156559